MWIPTNTPRSALAADGTVPASVPDLVRRRTGWLRIALVVMASVGLLACILALSLDDDWASQAWAVVMPSLKGSWPFRWPMTVPFATGGMPARIVIG